MLGAVASHCGPAHAPHAHPQRRARAVLVRRQRQPGAGVSRAGRRDQRRCVHRRRRLHRAELRHRTGPPRLRGGAAGGATDRLGRQRAQRRPADSRRRPRGRALPAAARRRRRAPPQAVRPAGGGAGAPAHRGVCHRLRPALGLLRPGQPSRTPGRLRPRPRRAADARLPPRAAPAAGGRDARGGRLGALLRRTDRHGLGPPAPAQPGPRRGGGSQRAGGAAFRAFGGDAHRLRPAPVRAQRPRPGARRAADPRRQRLPRRPAAAAGRQGAAGGQLYRRQRTAGRGACPRADPAGHGAVRPARGARLLSPATTPDAIRRTSPPICGRRC